ncbi:MAG: DNA gyrase subunit A [Thiotrichaceae bacterium]
MAHLFATTDLERSYRVNLNMIGLDGHPQVKKSQHYCKSGCIFAYKPATADSASFRQIYQRLHIVEGLLIAFLHLDAIMISFAMRTLQTDTDCQFQLSEIQVDAILELRLRQLAKLEQTQLTVEKNRLSEEQQTLEHYLATEHNLKTLLLRNYK